MLKKYVIFAIALLGASSTMAASAVTRADLNLRTGPGVSYPAVATVPNGQALNVLGCADRGRWCDVSWNGYRGWVSGSYLGAMATRAPVVVYDPVLYQRHYVGAPYVNPRAAARRDARIEYRVHRRMDRRWDRWTD